MAWELEEEMVIDSKKLHRLLRTTIHIYYIDFGNGFRVIYMSNLIKVYSFKYVQLIVCQLYLRQMVLNNSGKRKQRKKSYQPNFFKKDLFGS